MVSRKFLSLFCCLCALAGMAGGCVDHNYDLGRMERVAAVGGDNLTLPLGSIPQTKVSDLVGDRFGNLLILQPDDTYSMQYEADPVDFVFSGLKDYDGARPFQRYCNYPISTTFSLYSLANVPFDEKGEADLSDILPKTISLGTRSKGMTINIPRMPDQLLALKAITLTKDSRVNVTFSVPDCLLSEGTLTASVQVDLSRFFESEDAPGGIVSVSVPLTRENQYTATVTIPLHTFVFDPACYDPKTHALLTDVRIGFAGSVAVDGPRTTQDLFKKAGGSNLLKITAELRDIACESIEGKYEYQISEMHTRVDLSSLTSTVMEKLGDKEAVFDFDDPEVILEATTNLNAPTYAVVDFIAYKQGAQVAEMSGIVVDFPVASPGETISRRIRLGKTAHSPDDIILDFTDLIRVAPDEITVNVNGYTHTDKDGLIRVGEVYEAHVKPHVNIPLSFGPDLRLTFRDTLAVPDTLGYLIRDNSFVLQGELTNSLPLQLDVVIEMADSLGVVLTEPIEQTVAAEGTSALSIPLVNIAGDRIVDLRNAQLTFRVSGTDHARPIRADDFVEADLKLRIAGGYHHRF